MRLLKPNPRIGIRANDNSTWIDFQKRELKDIYY